MWFLYHWANNFSALANNGGTEEETEIKEEVGRGVD